MKIIKNCIMFIVAIILVVLCINLTDKYKIYRYSKEPDNYDLELNYIVMSINNPTTLDSDECKSMVEKKYTTKTGLYITYKDLTSDIKNIDKLKRYSTNKQKLYLPIDKINFQKLKYEEQDRFLKDIMIVAHEAAKEAAINDNMVSVYYSGLLQVDWIVEHNYIETDVEPLVDVDTILEKQGELEEKYGKAPSWYLWDEDGTLLYNPEGLSIEKE